MVNYKHSNNSKNIKHQVLLLTMVNAAIGWPEFNSFLKHNAEAAAKCLKKHGFDAIHDPEKLFMLTALNFSVTTSKNFLIANIKGQLIMVKTHKQTLSLRDYMVLWEINFATAHLQVKTGVKILTTSSKLASFQFELQCF